MDRAGEAPVRDLVGNARRARECDGQRADSSLRRFIAAAEGLRCSIGGRTRGRSVAAWCLAVLLLTGTARGQDADSVQEADTVVYPVWTTNLATKLTASQASFHNWTEGGISALSSTAQIAGDFIRESPTWKQSYETRLSFGVIKQDREELRKSEDLIRLKAAVNYAGDGFLKQFKPTATVGLRTQFAPGFNYEKNPFQNELSVLTPPVKVSDFFSPATFTQSLGLEYFSDWGFKQRLGVGAKETVVLINRFRTLYGLRESEMVRFQLGIESFTEIDKEIFKNVRLKSALGLFAAFNQDELPDMLWENLVVMKVNSWLSADFEFVSLFDRDISDALQIKESFSVGIALDII